MKKKKIDFIKNPCINTPLRNYEKPLMMKVHEILMRFQKVPPQPLNVKSLRRKAIFEETFKDVYI